MNTPSKPLMKFLPYFIGGILFFTAAARFFTLGDMVGAVISCASGLIAFLLVWTKR